MAIDNEQVNSQIKALNQKLKSSDTAYSPSGYTAADVSADVKLRKLESLKSAMNSNQARKDWYSEENSTTPVAKPEAGFIASALDTMQAPLRAVVGGVKYAAGKSSAKNIFGAINQNMQTEHDEFSSLLKGMNVPAPVAAPLGFALDLAMDPINWLTFGGGAAGAGTIGKIGEKGAVMSLNVDRAIPKLFYGAVKAGPEGAAKAVKSTFWDVAKGVMRIVHGANKNATLNNWVKATEKAGIASTDQVKLITKEMLISLNEGKTAEEVLRKAMLQFPEESVWKTAAEKSLQGTKVQGVRNKIQAFKTGLAEKSMMAKEAYEGSLGFSKVNPLIESIVRSNAERAKWSDVIRAEISKVGGEKILQAFDYNPKEWYRLAKIKDELYRTHNQASELKVIEALPQEMRDAADVARLAELRKTLKINPVDPAVKARFKQDTVEAREILDGDAKVYRSENLFDNSVRMEGEGIKAEEMLRNRANELIDQGVNPDDIKKIYNEITEGSAKPDWIDSKVLEMRKNLKEKNWTPAKIKTAETLLDAYENIYKTSIGVFKSIKVGGKFLSPAAHVNAYIGNHIMTHMFGFNITRADYLKSLHNAFGFYKGKEAATYAQRILGGEIEQYARDYPGLFSGMFGFTPNKIKMMRQINSEIDSQVGARILSVAEGEAMKKEALDGMAKSLEEIRDVSKQAKSEIKPGNVFTDDAQRLEYAGQSGFTGASYIANELTDPGIVRLRNNIKLRSDAGEKWAKVANYVLNKGPQEYEMIDQSNRLGLFTHMIKNGLTEGELQKISRGIALNPGTDLVKTVVNGEKLYKIKPDKANEIVSLVYMNYAAMPAFVRMMRSVPLVGSPFFSFSYGMGAKTVQTLADNPASINKVSNAMNSIETLFGGRSPLEKKELETSPYYSWYNKPGMVSLSNMSFFRDNPVFLNATNFIPYMSLNMISPSERKYDATWPGRIAGMVDKSPLFKGPGGSVIFDYMIQPQLLGIKEPQNQFGSALYPKSATGVEKSLVYPLRSLAEAFAPPSAGLVAAATPAVPENMIKYIPSYNVRRAENAKYGKSSVGVSGKEPAGERTLRGALGTLGVSINPLDLTKSK